MFNTMYYAMLKAAVVEPEPDYTTNQIPIQTIQSQSSRQAARQPSKAEHKIKNNGCVKMRIISCRIGLHAYK